MTNYNVSCAGCGRVWRLREGDRFTVQFIEAGGFVRCLNHRTDRGTEIDD